MNGAIVWHDISRWQVMRIMTVPSGHLGRTAAIHLGYAGSVFQGSSNLSGDPSQPAEQLGPNLYGHL